MMVNINSNIDYESAELVASEFGITLEKQVEKTFEEKLAERGIILKQRIAMQPAVEEVAQIFNGKDYNIKVNKEEYIPLQEELVMYMEDESWL